MVDEIQEYSLTVDPKDFIEHDGRTCEETAICCIPNIIRMSWNINEVVVSTYIGDECNVINEMITPTNASMLLECEYILIECKCTLKEVRTDPYKKKNINFSLVELDSDSWNDMYTQRIERGFDDSELWSLDTTIVHFILPRLKRYIEVACDIIDDERHFNNCDTIVEALEEYENRFENDETDWDLVRKGFKLFIDELPAMWI